MWFASAVRHCLPPPPPLPPPNPPPRGLFCLTNLAQSNLFQVVEVFDAGEGASKFTFHTPFTAGGRVHGSTAEQCKKLTELEVKQKLNQAAVTKKIL